MLDWIAMLAVIVVIGFHVLQALQAGVDPSTLKVNVPSGEKGAVTLPDTE